MRAKSIIMAVLSLFDKDERNKMLQRLEDQLRELQSDLTHEQYENSAWMWLWRKCGGIFYGAKTVCAAGCNIYASSQSGMGRQRSTLQGAGQATLGAEEAENEGRC
ncbi:hypothetical protein JQN58_04955 [Aneurinibacillus sp. BA2021]|nr:hypothetical protein [Aneurinibacillus sp. BA2021]